MFMTLTKSTTSKKLMFQKQTQKHSIRSFELFKVTRLPKRNLQLLARLLLLGATSLCLVHATGCVNKEGDNSDGTTPGCNGPSDKTQKVRCDPCDEQAMQMQLSRLRKKSVDLDAQSQPQPERTRRANNTSPRRKNSDLPPDMGKLYLCSNRKIPAGETIEVLHNRRWARETVSSSRDVYRDGYPCPWEVYLTNPLHITVIRPHIIKLPDMAMTIMSDKVFAENDRVEVRCDRHWLETTIVKVIKPGNPQANGTGEYVVSPAYPGIDTDTYEHVVRIVPTNITPKNIHEKRIYDEGQEICPEVEAGVKRLKSGYKRPLKLPAGWESGVDAGKLYYWETSDPSHKSGNGPSPLDEWDGYALGTIGRWDGATGTYTIGGERKPEKIKSSSAGEARRRRRVMERLLRYENHYSSGAEGYPPKDPSYSA